MVCSANFAPLRACVLPVSNLLWQCLVAAKAVAILCPHACEVQGSNKMPNDLVGTMCTVKLGSLLYKLFLLWAALNNLSFVISALYFRNCITVESVGRGAV